MFVWYTSVYLVYPCVSVIPPVCLVYPLYIRVSGPDTGIPPVYLVYPLCVWNTPCISVYLVLIPVYLGIPSLTDIELD